MILLLGYVGGVIKLPFGWELQNPGFRAAAQKSISQLSDLFFFFLKGFCSTHCCSTEVFNCHCDDLLIFKEVVEANVFQVQPMDKVRYSLTISSNHNQLAPENMFYLALSQPLCLQVICTPTEKSW